LIDHDAKQTTAGVIIDEMELCPKGSVSDDVSGWNGHPYAFLDHRCDGTVPNGPSKWIPIDRRRMPIIIIMVVSMGSLYLVVVRQFLQVT